MAFRRKPPPQGSSRSDAGEGGRPGRHSSFKPKPRPKGGREVDERKTRAALRKLRRAVEQAEERAKEGGEGEKLSAWEREFAKSVETKLETYGSAFRDPSKGRLEEPLSARQSQKLREIGKKAAGKGGGPKRASSFKRKDPPKRGGRVRDVSVIEEDEAPSEASPAKQRKAPRRRT